ncbi:MAG: site-specific integrase [Chitinophagales bacterium]|nr:site-specific integrase [Chitinophagales bacterium]
MIKKTFSYTLLPINNDLSKRWFIKAKVFNIDTLSVEYLRKYDSRLNRFRTVDARLLVYPQVLASIDEDLQNNTTYWGSVEEYAEWKRQQVETKPTIIEVLIGQLETHKLRKKSYSTFLSKINNLHNYMKNNGLTEITQPDAVKFLAKFISPVTRNSNLSTLNGLLDEVGYMPNPFQGFKKLKESKQGRMYFTLRQLSELKRNILPKNKMLWVACEMQYYCLIRNGEMRDLLVGDVDLDSGLIVIRGEIAKNWKTLPVRIPKAFFQLLSDYIGDAPSGAYLYSKSGKPGGTQISTKYLNNELDKYLIRLKMKTPRHSFYSFKKSGAKGFLDMPNANYKALQRQGRWQDLREVESYTADLGVGDFAEQLDNIAPI